MPRRKKSNIKTYLWVFLAIAILGTAGYFSWYFLIRPQAVVTPTTPTAQEFSITVQDPIRGITLDNDDFNFTLYGVEADDLDSFSKYDILDNGTDLDGISNSTLDPEYDYYILRYSANTSDEDLFNDNGEYHFYYERWSQIFPDTANTLTAYEQFSEVSVTMLYQENGSVVTDSIGYSDGINATYANNYSYSIIGNQSQDKAAYISCYNYEDQDYDTLDLVIVMNSTVEKGDYDIDGVSESREGTTSLRYSIDSFYGNLLLNGYWDEDVDDLEIDEFLLYWGDTLLYNSSA